MAQAVTIPDIIPTYEHRIIETCAKAYVFLAHLAGVADDRTAGTLEVKLNDLVRSIVSLSWERNWRLETTVSAVMDWAERTAGDLPLPAVPASIL